MFLYTEFLDPTNTLLSRKTFVYVHTSWIYVILDRYLDLNEGGEPVGMQLSRRCGEFFLPVEGGKGMRLLLCFESVLGVLTDWLQFLFLCFVTLTCFDSLSTWRLATRHCKTPLFAYICACVCVCGRVLSWLNRVTNSCQWFGKKHISYACHFEVRRNGLGINDAGYRWLHFGWCTLAAADRIRWGCAGALTLKKHRRNPCKNWPKCLFWIHYLYKYCKSTMNAFLSFYIKDHNMIRRYYTYYLWYTYIVYNYIMYRLSNLTKTYAYLSIYIYIYTSYF